MSDKPTQTPWNPYRIDTEEHRAILKSSGTIDKAMERTQMLAMKLADDGSLPEQDARWLIHMAYAALLKVWIAVRVKECITPQRQEASQRTDELPPNEPVPVPEWLQELQQGGG